MTFGLLTTLGLRQHHRVLDVGCGSLRSGRLLIPYLNVGNYTGLEPNEWLIGEGIHRETGEDQIRIKRPNLIVGSTAGSLDPAGRYDFAVAQSIFSHCGTDLLEGWLTGLSPHLPDTGALVATFLVAEQDYTGSGWVYPGCVHYRISTMERLARQAGLGFRLLDWKHPRQSWALFAKPSFPVSWFAKRELTWNNRLLHGPR
jgi:cyclopropane fatty-acyl-phospholipid synthase-like methyltransferase